MTTTTDRYLPRSTAHDVSDVSSRYAELASQFPLQGSRFHRPSASDFSNLNGGELGSGVRLAPGSVEDSVTLPAQFDPIGDVPLVSLGDVGVFGGSAAAVSADSSSRPGAIDPRVEVAVGDGLFPVWMSTSLWSVCSRGGTRSLGMSSDESNRHSDLMFPGSICFLGKRRSAAAPAFTEYSHGIGVYI